MKKTVVGILAHVDAGKTTLSEGFLYAAGQIGRLGRVDKKDAFFDTHPIERDRGITIFSKQAAFEFGDTYMTLIDTPGHVDFSCEAERALSVQDYAILIVSAPDGVTAHTKTLWHLLSSRHIPTFIFVNKTDISDRKKDGLLAELSSVLSSRCVDFTSDSSEEFFEAAAGCDERLMEEYFDTGELSVGSIASAVAKRRIFPCFFGSALKMRGVEEFLRALDKYILPKNYSDRYFGAKVYKISRDHKDKRLTFVKITGGVLRPKDTLTLRDRYGNETVEKIEEIRIYSGEKYKSAQKVEAGAVCALLGPVSTKVGDGLGSEPSDEQTLTPVLDYRIILPKEANPYETYMRLMALTEEDPSLALTYDAATHELRVRLMGEIQLEVLSRIIAERFGLSVSFDEGAILYKETVGSSVFGAGHFEPLRHYAEVHLRIDPLSEGSGVISATECPVDTLSLNWQRLVMTHIEERVHRGVLTGSPLTDVKITLTAGRAHLKHTEGGDFRQATYRAIRQALMKSERVLLEPTFDFRMELPSESLGRAMLDITNMGGVCSAPEFVGDTAVLEGNCPVSTMRSYATELRAYTRGEGRLALTVGGYAPCHNAEEVIEKKGYDPTLDERNPAGSVFCKGGAGYAVSWDEADELMHITDTGAPRRAVSESLPEFGAVRKTAAKGGADEEKELMRIFEMTYGKVKPRRVAEKIENSAAQPQKPPRPRKPVKKGEQYLIVDGYNFIFANEPLRRIAESDISRARDTVIRMLCDYSAFHRVKAIVVFDAYKREGGEGSAEQIGGVSVIYTKEKQTADAYIEKTTYEISDEHTVRVVTSDMQEQLIILGSGGLRVSAAEFYEELNSTLALIRQTIENFK